MICLMLNVMLSLVNQEISSLFDNFTNGSNARNGKIDKCLDAFQDS